MSLIGLMITRDDEAVFSTWCDQELRHYDAVVCLDGSTTDATRRISQVFSRNLVYLHEREFDIPYKTDHGLRRVVAEDQPLAAFVHYGKKRRQQRIRNQAAYKRHSGDHSGADVGKGVFDHGSHQKGFGGRIG